jgi:hypothetical protein
MELPSDYRQKLLTMVNTYRPLGLSELVKLAALAMAAWHNIVRLCGLTLLEGMMTWSTLSISPQKTTSIRRWGQLSSVLSRCQAAGLGLGR